MNNEILLSMPEDTKFFTHSGTPLAYSPSTGICWKALSDGYWKRVKPGCEQRSKCRYTSLGLSGKNYTLHRLLAEVFLNGGQPLPAGIEVDHIKSADGTHWQDRLENLRLATKSQNLHSKSSGKIPVSGFRGVQYRGRDKWAATIRVSGVVTNIGIFKTPELAARAYDDAALEGFGEFAYTNAKLGLLNYAY